MRYKYVHKKKPNSSRRRRPEEWISGPDPLKHEKYYAWLKHRAQARYRGEDYEIQWEDWEQLWSDDDFLRRGRHKNDLCLSRKDIKQAWSLHNCQVTTRDQHLKRNQEFRKGPNGQ